MALDWGTSQTHSGNGFLLGKGHVSADVSRSYQQTTVISMVHEVAVGAAPLAVRALGICGVTVKFSIATVSANFCLASPWFMTCAGVSLRLALLMHHARLTHPCLDSLSAGIKVFDS